MSTPVPGGQPELTGQVMFYRRPEPLSLEKHRDLGVKQIAAPFSFLRTAHAVPITVSEFGVAATCFPIIFVGNDRTPVAVMGVRQNENEYVDAAGQHQLRRSGLDRSRSRRHCLHAGAAEPVDRESRNFRRQTG